MRLENFEVSSDIELQSGNLSWDLYNFADFDRLELISTENAAMMRWSVPSSPNPWGCYENNSSGMALRFKDLRFLHVGSRDKGLPLTEDTCVSYVLKVDPTIDAVDPYLRTRNDWKEDFRLVFHFQSGRMIEIESESVELIPIS